VKGGPVRKSLFFVAVVLGVSFLGFALPPYPPPDIVAQVIRVIDGDTIDVKLLQVPDKYGPNLHPEAVVRVRYIAVDAPEPNQPDGPKATELNQLLVENKIVYLELDDNWWDPYGRLLAYVYLDPYGYLMVNMMLVATPIIGVRFYSEQRYEAVLQQADKLGVKDDDKGSGCSGGPDLQVLYVTSPVRAGHYATVQIKTTPGASCTITVYYPSGPSRASGLEPKIAGENGIVEWTWKVGTRTTPGQHKIVITATLCGQTKTTTVYFETW